MSTNYPPVPQPAPDRSRAKLCKKLDRLARRLDRFDVEFDGVRQDLTRIFHSGIEQRSGESVRRLDITQPNENAIHRFFDDRL